jgi:hypothetical protein
MIDTSTRVALNGRKPSSERTLPVKDSIRLPVLVPTVARFGPYSF